MFYCNNCAKMNAWPESLFKSAGKCECCDTVTVCNDRPSSSLPSPKQKEVLEKEIIGMYIDYNGVLKGE